jgi:hypothetical protein
MKSNKSNRGGARQGAGRPAGKLSEAKRQINEAKRTLREMAREHAEDAIGTLANIAKTSESDQAKVAAIKELLDRGFGKATQPISGDEDGPPVAVQHSIEIKVVDPADGSDDQG